MLNVKHKMNVRELPPSLTHAAQHNDFDEANEALALDPSCINEKDLNDMNALQLAISECHEDMALFLMRETKISAMHQDVHGRDALDLVIHIGSDELCEAVEKRWNEEYKIAMEPGGNKNVSSMQSKPTPK